MSKKNCWEFKKCGRQPGGDRVKEQGICPAVTETRLHCAHGGTNAGRACWVVTGTFCNNEVQGTAGKKFSTCEQCDFYQSVRQEEGPNFLISLELLSIMRR